MRTSLSAALLLSLQWLTVIADNHTASDQNLCILQHMLSAYTTSDDLKLSNIAKLFDAVTVGYHSQMPSHALTQNSEVESGEPPHVRRRRGIHIAGTTDKSFGSQATTPDICEHELEGTLHKCLPGSQILQTRNFNKTDVVLSVKEFESLCPALLFQLTMAPCNHHPHTFLEEGTTPHPISATNSHPHLAWVGSIAAVVVISICGLAVISFIPLIKKSFYKQAIQFLVALAVGTLVGDALLHLLPHALSEHEEAHTDLRSSTHHVWRASVSLLGIFIFFNAERIMGAVTSIKRDKKAAADKRKDGHGEDGDIKSEGGSCGSCAEVPYVTGHSSREIKEMANDAHKELHRMNRIPCRQSTELVHLAGEANCHDCPLPQQSKSCQLADLAENPTTNIHSSMPALNNAAAAQPDQVRVEIVVPTATTPLINSGLLPITKISDPNYNGKACPLVEGEEEEADGHGHGHSHDIPGSCSSVAYMVIMGDGLHNFTDGLAIGAAFSSSFTGGMSTSIAVLCHELPHELGDFAMLLKTGMSLKQAYLCNLVSATLQCLGAVIGVLIGNVGAASQWLFAFAGGIFLYVGLVDMLPEITKVDHKRAWKQLVLQNAGLLLGFTFMLLIAAFENDIENAFVIK